MARHFAIVPAAGSGSRFGAQTPKQYLPLLGLPLIHHSLAALCASPAIDRVWVVLAPDDEGWGHRDWSALGPKLETLRAGGATRAESVANGLRAAATVADDDDWILVHDAARPCLRPADVAQLVSTLADDPVGGLLAVPVADTLKRADGQGRVAATEPREGLWQAQTPQMFRYGLLRRALAATASVTDEAGAIEALGERPRLVPGEGSNLKVTYPADLAIAEAILRGRR
ncbi:MAG: 2-C-methyl-D-erythritol 4-phosphate cytidylyltransferase [Azonexus sp.]|nr:2-C-methyl-D-erythritol 4-phosphate cytidylyltransferase [Betaproteobacteria bacterium]MBK8917885.1 2-C-methyl-D-erythritol 4-phosphate cytidylyltransferase [Betaproteobacteria bacterium]MBP6037546.1 2-C-methyl-D-erythritol 4-phosphate cytidylyltransferase [Azonexus sp.]MBP6908119.1 2-C-methyl-D-erythritol 4-phosphate cytidylyltransferase [Azonexus sp.]